MLILDSYHVEIKKTDTISESFVEAIAEEEAEMASQALISSTNNSEKVSKHLKKGNSALD